MMYVMFENDDKKWFIYAWDNGWKKVVRFESRKIWFESNEQKWGEMKEKPIFWKMWQLIRIRDYVIRITSLMIQIKNKILFESNGPTLTRF